MNKIKRWFKDHIPYFIVLFLVVILIFVALWPRILVFIKPGEAGVIYRLLSSGTVTDYVYPEGLHMILPLNTMYVYDTRMQVILHDFEVLTSSGLPIKLALAIRYQPIYELLGVLHQRVGPDYPNKIILPQIESVLRQNIGGLTPEDVYTNKKGVLSEIITLALEEVGRKYIHVDDIIIRSVILPDSVKASIEAKLVNEQELLAYAFKLQTEEEEKKRKIIEASGIKLYQEAISPTLNEPLLKWLGIKATLELSESPNSKVVVIGSGDGGLPIILGDK
ncbi:prohibitin family protein [Algibacillus agarilyticus]|uniref:prohibitin family protein n=1 Tax=Algibacillus agarilyticus TaxID=2234133 RepID=UPI000DD0478F|nr:prohibitin family protein [Algibacillus agarilyticus]